jgi:hypothetical protein
MSEPCCPGFDTPDADPAVAVALPRADLRTLAAEAIREGQKHFLTPEALADAVLAAVLPEHRRMVLGEAADELTSEIEWQREKYGDGSSKVGIGRLIGMEDARATLRRLAAAAPPAGLSATGPAGNAPAVPEPPVRPASDGDALTYAEMESERDRLARELYEAHAILGAVVAERDGAKDGTRRAWLELEHWRTVIVPELMEQRDRLGTDRDRLAAQVDRVRALHTALDGRCVECVEYCDCLDRVTELGDDVEVAASARMCNHGQEPWPCPTIAAVDALPDAGTDRTEDDRGST